MNRGSTIERFEDRDVYCARIKNFNETTIDCTKHTFFRLGQKQREIYTCDMLKKIILNERPVKVGIQRNRNFASYYRHKKKLLKIVLSIKPSNIKIVTFYMLDASQLPRG